MASATSYPVRRSTRLQGYDYSQAGAYFITLCTEDRVCRFGTVQDDDVELGPVGEMVAESWLQLGDRFGVGIDAFVVMPNHLHGILVVNHPIEGAKRPEGQDRVLTAGLDSVPARFVAGPQDGLRPIPLPEIVRRFKSYTANQARSLDPQLRSRNTSLWQRNYHDRIIRNDRELEAIRAYIANNPLAWSLDREHPVW